MLPTKMKDIRIVLFIYIRQFLYAYNNALQISRCSIHKIISAFVAAFEYVMAESRAILKTFLYLNKAELGRIKLNDRSNEMEKHGGAIQCE